MAIPSPVPGLVIPFSYLWYREHFEGREEGHKNRPCVIVAAVRVDGNGDTRVLVLPVTHTPPTGVGQCVELPQRVKQRLRLDDAASWVVLTEWNEFVWPGPDLRRRPGADDFAYGMLPPRLFAAVRDGFLAIVEKRAASRVLRTE